MEYEEPILKALKKEPLSGKKLLFESNIILKKEKASNQSQSFKEALLILLDKKMIQIEEYQQRLDTRNGRIQSLNPDGFIFSLVKTEPNDIQQLINELDNTKDKIFKKNYQELKHKIVEIKPSNVNASMKSNILSLINKIDSEKIDQNTYYELKNKIERIETSNVNGAFKEEMTTLINKIDFNSSNIYQELQRLFVKKIDDIESKNFQNWEYLLKYKVIKRELIDDEILYYEALNEVNDEYNNSKEKQKYFDLLDFNEEVKLRMGELKGKLSEFRLKNKDLKLFLLEVPKKINPLMDQSSYSEQEEYQLQREVSYQQSIKLHDPKPKSISGRYTFDEESVTEEDYLIQTTRFESPIKRDLKLKHELFEDVIFYLRSQESNQGLKYRLATGLSESRRSNEILNSLVTESTENKLIIDYSLDHLAL